MSRENVEIVRRWWDGFNNTGMPPLSLCDERIEIRNPPDFPVRGSFHGHQGVRDWRDQVFEALDNASVEVEEIIDVPDGGETVVMLPEPWQLPAIRGSRSTFRGLRFGRSGTGRFCSRRDT